MSEPRIRLDLQHAKVLVDFLRGFGLTTPARVQARAALERAVATHSFCRTLAKAERPVSPAFPKPDPADRKAKARREDAAQARKDREVYRAVQIRAMGMCECGCDRELDIGGPDGIGQMDHFRGRGKEPTRIDNTWLIRAGCHSDKTDNKPGRAYWLGKFLVHCNRYGYKAQAARCVRELEAERDIARAAEVSRGR